LGYQEKDIKWMLRHPPLVFRRETWDDEQKAKLASLLRPYLQPPVSLDEWETVVIQNKILDPVEKFFDDKGLPKSK